MNTINAKLTGKFAIFRGFRKTLSTQLGEDAANIICQNANVKHKELAQHYPEITGDSKMMILPSAALYMALSEHAPERVDLLKDYGTQVGERIARVVHVATSIPGVSRLLWNRMPGLMRAISSAEKGYTRKIVSETRELVGVDILSCPLHDAVVKIGVPEAAHVVCAMDKAYMTGFKHIRYTRTTSVAEGDPCCDYRLTYDRNKK